MLRHNLLAYLPLLGGAHERFGNHPAGAYARCQGGTTELIDVRTPVEFLALHVAHAKNVPLDRLDPAVLSRRPPAGRTAVRGLPVGHAGKTGLRKVARRRSDRRLERGGRDRGLPTSRPARGSRPKGGFAGTAGPHRGRLAGAAGRGARLVSHPAFSCFRRSSGRAWFSPGSRTPAAWVFCWPACRGTVVRKPRATAGWCRRLPVRVVGCHRSYGSHGAYNNEQPTTDPLRTTMPNRENSPAGYAIGVDYGTNSVRALVVDVADGRKSAPAFTTTPAARRASCSTRRIRTWPGKTRPTTSKGSIARSAAVQAAAKRRRGFRPEHVVGIGVDTTGSTPHAGRSRRHAAGADARVSRNLAAQAWLWKDHTEHAEAAEITEQAARAGDGYLAKCGGAYSSEWYWSKILHCRRTAPKVFAAAYRWVELADFVPGLHHRQSRSRHAPARHLRGGPQGDVQRQWGGLPSKEFLASSTGPGRAAPSAMPPPALPADRPAGGLAADVAEKVGLPPGMPVAVGAFDAHMGAVGAGIKPGTLVKIIGTSTCDMMVAPWTAPARHPGPVRDRARLGRAGHVRPGGRASRRWATFSTGSSSTWPRHAYTAKGDPHAKLTREAEQLRPGTERAAGPGLEQRQPHDPGRSAAGGLLVGQTLHTTAAGNLSGPGRGHGLRRADHHPPAGGVRRGRSAKWSTAAALPRRTPS